jgi:hypothetical protein
VYNQQVFIHNVKGHYLSSVSITDVINNVVWTPCGNIVYSILDNNKVVVISQTDQVIKQTNKYDNA